MILVDVFFAFFNSALLFGLFWFVFRKKLAPQITREMYEKKEVREQLGDERVRLAHTLTLIDRDREFRDEQYRTLMEKVATWVAFEESVAGKRIFEKTSCREHYCNRIQTQMEYFRLAQIEHEVFPVALQAAEQELKKHFSNRDAGQAYISRAMISLLGDSHV
ncbi:MAG: hypothetical protein UV79_C0002G0007 [candidate division TM6 bacterium GW2011_GWF2_43_17]|nr:MAG: hypothetical protein UV79_C0002G0007 [candidate division TM6 bacterium GW2011_GWF2_43_17]HAU30176.1 hypothetical protein [Candidatus Dependentiae bacterium]